MPPLVPVIHRQQPGGAVHHIAVAPHHAPAVILVLDQGLIVAPLQNALIPPLLLLGPAAGLLSQGRAASRVTPERRSRRSSTASAKYRSAPRAMPPDEMAGTRVVFRLQGGGQAGLQVRTAGVVFPIPRAACPAGGR